MWSLVRPFATDKAIIMSEGLDTLGTEVCPLVERLPYFGDLVKQTLLVSSLLTQAIRCRGL